MVLSCPVVPVHAARGGHLSCPIHYSVSSDDPVGSLPLLSQIALFLSFNLTSFLICSLSKRVMSLLMLTFLYRAFSCPLGFFANLRTFTTSTQVLPTLANPCLFSYLVFWSVSYLHEPVVHHISPKAPQYCPPPFLMHQLTCSPWHKTELYMSFWHFSPSAPWHSCLHV